MAEKKEKQYVSDNAQLMAEWNWEKNNELGLDPNKLTCGSGRKVWWECNFGHEWLTTIEKRAKEKTGCPYCSGHKVASRINDLETLYPDIATEWNTAKNGDLLPTMVSPGSRKKVWWRCALGHEWEAEIVNRTTSKSGCPYCAGKKVLSGFNDLLTLNPNLAAEWNVQKNGILSPSMVSLHSGKSVWWKCKNGHEWQALIANRV